MSLIKDTIKLKEKRARSMALVLIIACVFTFAFGAEICFAASDDVANLTSLEIYNTAGYKSHDCVLTSNAYMLRRAAILRGSQTWDEITINSLRPKACTSKHGSSLRFEYSYTADGVTYTVRHGYLTGSGATKKSKLRKLLDKHPEGIVVRGPSRSGGHGVLMTGYSGDTFYAVDSALNLKGMRNGIRTFYKTTMTSIPGLSQYWYLVETKGSVESAITEAEVTNLQAKQSSDFVVLTWDVDGECDLDGYVVYQKAEGSDDYERVGRTQGTFYTFKNPLDGKQYRYKVVGYKKVNGHTVYTDKDSTKLKLASVGELIKDEVTEVVKTLKGETEEATDENAEAAEIPEDASNDDDFEDDETTSAPRADDEE